MGAVALGSATAGVLGVLLGLVFGVSVVFVIGTVLSGATDRLPGSTVDTAVDLVPVVIGVPCIALCTALASYLLVESRTLPGWTPKPKFEAGRLTVWTTAVFNSIAFAAVAIATPKGLFTLMFVRVWLWPLYILPVAIGARAAALAISRRREAL